MPTDTARFETMLDELMGDDSDGLTPSDVEYLELLVRSVDEGYQLSDTQCGEVERLWNKVFSD